MPGIVTVKDIVENFLTSSGIDLDATDLYILGLYDDLVAVPYPEYKQLLYYKDLYQAMLDGEDRDA